MKENKDFASRLKDLGVEIYSAAKKEFEAVVSSAEKQFKKEKLRKRFNLENPYKFVLLDSSFRVKLLDSLMARHAKKYDEDDILVFFGGADENTFEKGHRIKDLSDDSIMEVLEIVEVKLPVRMEDTTVDVPCTAIYGKVL
jgi:spore coat polysaccharide biosynthesis predicted glycosyltransferase SpsG